MSQPSSCSDTVRPTSHTTRVKSVPARTRGVRVLCSAAEPISLTGKDLETVLWGHVPLGIGGPGCLGAFGSCSLTREPGSQPRAPRQVAGSHCPCWHFDSQEQHLRGRDPPLVRDVLSSVATACDTGRMSGHSLSVLFSVSLSSGSESSFALGGGVGRLLLQATGRAQVPTSSPSPVLRRPRPVSASSGSRVGGGASCPPERFIPVPWAPRCCM